MPPMIAYWDMTPEHDPFYVAMNKGISLNRIAAIFAGLSALCAGGSSLISTN